MIICIYPWLLCVSAKKKAPPLRNSLWRNKLVPFPPDCSSTLQQQLRLWSTPLHILSGAAALYINLFSYLGCKQDLNSGCNMCRDNSKHHFTSSSDFFPLFSTDGQDANEWLWSDPCVDVIDSKPLILTDAWKNIWMDSIQTYRILDYHNFYYKIAYCVLLWSIFKAFKTSKFFARTIKKSE